MPPNTIFICFAGIGSCTTTAPLDSISSIETTTSHFLDTSSDSPVNISSLILRFILSISLPSAGTMSPVSIYTISPGTNSLLEIWCTSPSLNTFTSMFSVNLERASAAFLERPSVIIPIAIPIAIAPTIPIASWVSPITALTTAAIIKITIIGSLKLSFKSSQKLPSSFGVNSFKPYFSLLVLTSDSDKPFSGLTDKSFVTSSLSTL